MKSLLYLRLIIKTLGNNKLRNFFAVVVIGIAVVVMLIDTALKTGVRQELDDLMENVIARQLIVNPGRQLAIPGRGGQWFAAQNLKQLDLETLAAVAGVELLSPLVTGAVLIEYKNKNTNTTVNGVNPDFATINNLIPARGRFIQSADNNYRQRVVVLGATVARKLFGSYALNASNSFDVSEASNDANSSIKKSILGEIVLVSGIPFQIVGILEDKGTNATGMDQDDNVYIAKTTALRRVFNIEYFTRLIVQSDRYENLNQVADKLRIALRINHRIDSNQPDDFEILSPIRQQQARRFNSSLLSGLFKSFSVVTLLIAAVGIAAISYLNLRERRSEFGLRKAVGATWYDALLLVLIENAMLGATAAVVGCAFGAVLIVTLAGLTSWPLQINFEGIGVPASLAILLAIAASIYPALLAARMQPVAALANNN